MKRILILVTLCFSLIDVAIGQQQKAGFDIREFSGFRFGSPHSDPTDTNRQVEVELAKPFRLFKKAELCYTHDNKLYLISLKLQDRMMSYAGISFPLLSKGATFDVTLEAMQEEHVDLVEWIKAEYGIQMEKTKKLGEPACYSFINENIKIIISRCNRFGANQLSFNVYDARLDNEILLAQAKARDETIKRDRELALMKNEFGRNKAEQSEFEKSVKIQSFWGFEFGKPNANLPVIFDARIPGKGKLKKPFLNIEDVFYLSIDGATSNLTAVSLKKAYSKVPQREREKLSREHKYERPGLYERQKEVADWFAKEYKIILVEDKIMRTFSFRNDYAFIQIKRTPYNDTITIHVSGNKTPSDKTKDKPVATIPASSLNLNNFTILF